MADDEERTIGGGKSRPRQVRKARKDGWTGKKRRIFLDHLAATCNVARSAKAGGMTDGSAFALRRRDPAFAADWDAALTAGRALLDGMLIERAARSKASKGQADDPPPPDPSTMDTELALALLKHHQGSLAGRPRRGGARPRRATKEETDEAILRKLKALKRRMGGW